MRAGVLADLAIDTFGYRFLYLLHLLTVIVGFGSTFVYPILGAEAGKRRGIEAKALSDASLIAAKRVTTPVIYLTAVLGLVTAILGPWDLGDAWIAIAVVLVLVAIAFSALVHVPNLRRMNVLAGELATMGPPPAGAAAAGATAPGGPAGGPPPQAVEMEERSKRAAMNGGLLHLLFLLIVIDMIWKPGT